VAGKELGSEILKTFFVFDLKSCKCDRPLFVEFEIKDEK
jgi:hypothetical protein